MSKNKRIINANKFLEVAAKCGRCFFEHEGFVSYFGTYRNGRVYFVDYFTNKKICIDTPTKNWDGFTSGGTLKEFINALGEYIRLGEKLNLSYFTDKGFMGDKHIWGYGDDLEKLYRAAEELEIAE